MVPERALTTARPDELLLNGAKELGLTLGPAVRQQFLYLRRGAAAMEYPHQSDGTEDGPGGGGETFPGLPGGLVPG